MRTKCELFQSTHSRQGTTSLSFISDNTLFRIKHNNHHRRQPFPKSILHLTDREAAEDAQRCPLPEQSGDRTIQPESGGIANSGWQDFSAGPRSDQSRLTTICGSSRIIQAPSGTRIQGT